jgi:hypothetical protein
VAWSGILRCAIGRWVACLGHGNLAISIVDQMETVCRKVHGPPIFSLFKSGPVFLKVEGQEPDCGWTCWIWSFQWLLAGRQIAKTCYSVWQWDLRFHTLWRHLLLRNFPTQSIPKWLNK